METKLARIAELAKNNPDMKFTSLAHLLNNDYLKQCHYQLPNNKAAGVKGTTKNMYEQNLEENIEGLISRMKRKSYRTSPARRAFQSKKRERKDP